MQYEIIGWTYYDDPQYEEIRDPEKMAYLTTTVIKEIRRCGYRFTGDMHATARGYVPVFNSGEKFCTSQRQWGAIMAQAWHEENKNGMGYAKWHLGMGGADCDAFIYPELGVDACRIAADVTLEYEPLLDEEYYSAGPRSREEYESLTRETLEFIRKNHIKMLEPIEKRHKNGL